MDVKKMALKTLKSLQVKGSTNNEDFVWGYEEGYKKGSDPVAMDYECFIKILKDNNLGEVTITDKIGGVTKTVTFRIKK